MSTTNRREETRVAAATIIGTAIEWYDFSSTLQPLAWSLTKFSSLPVSQPSPRSYLS